MSLNIKNKKIKLRLIKYKGKEYAMDTEGHIVKDISKYNIYDKFNMINGNIYRHDIYDLFSLRNGDVYKIGDLFISQNGRQKVFVKNSNDDSIFKSARSKVKTKLDSINKKKYLEWANSEFAPGGPGFLRLVKKYNKSIKRPKSNSLKRKSSYKRETRKIKTI